MSDNQAAATTTPTVSRRSWLTLVAMTGGLSMIMLDQTVVSVALPTMARHLPLSGNGAQWVVNAYVLALAATVAIFGRLGGRIGPATTFRIGVIIFFFASAFCGLAPHGSYGEEWIIAARVLQGIGAAVMMPVSASIVMAEFPAAMRGRAMGAYVGISQIFLALGPLLGGAFTEWLSWRLVFWINVPVGIAALVLLRFTRPANPKDKAATLNPLQCVLLIVGICATVYALQQSSTWGWSSTRFITVVAAGLVAMAVFSWLQVRSSNPLVNVRLFGNRGFLGDSLVLFTTQFGLLAVTLFASLYAQNLLGFSPVTAGVTAMAMILPLMVAAQLSGSWFDKVGTKPPVLVGLAITAIGMIVWTLTLPEINFISKVPGMMLVGFGLGLVFSPVNTDALSRVSGRERAQASGIVQTVRQLGGTLGVAVIGAVILARENPHIEAPDARVDNVADAMQAGFWVAVAVFVVGLMAAWLLIPRGRVASDDPILEPAM